MALKECWQKAVLAPTVGLARGSADTERSVGTKVALVVSARGSVGSKVGLAQGSDRTTGSAGTKVPNGVESALAVLAQGSVGQRKGWYQSSVSASQCWHQRGVGA